MSLVFCDIDTIFGKKQILRKASLTAKDGLLTGIVGPNGSGKSTLIKTLFALAPITGGQILLDDVSTAHISRRQLARKVGYVGQEMACAFDFTVREVVAMGRFPHRSADRSRRTDDVVDESLAALHMQQFAERSIKTLSGGEKKMVFLARAVAQEVDVIVLDEPTNHLDICHQLFIMDYLKGSGKTILVVLHDLNLAARYCDELCLMCDGSVIANGSASEVLTEGNVKRVFGVNGKISRQESGRLAFKLL
ncbi:MAG: ABC transporter ATP-binding protein [Clostridiales Family XIII bacterium]|jgi:iron complex transport system ATP-binding protein|nr:ABC transporter ATP-binding protein [Clostridiales Family XIII bacterium]